jgi:hypothetical protein
LRRQLESSVELTKLQELLGSPHAPILRQVLTRLLGARKLEIAVNDSGQWELKGQTMVPGTMLMIGGALRRHQPNVMRLTSFWTGTIRADHSAVEKCSLATHPF